MSREDAIRRYETMIVLRSDLQEAGTKEQIERIRKVLEAGGATVGGVHEWGLRELAYEIGKERRGFYVLVEATCTAAALAELERNLKLSDAVLRFVSVRQRKDTPPAAVIPRDDAPVALGGVVEDEEGLADVEAGDVE